MEPTKTSVVQDAESSCSGNPEPKTLRIAVLAPVTLELLVEGCGESTPPGYPFPMTAYLVREYIQRGHKVVCISTSPGLSSTWQREIGDNLKLVVVPSRIRARERALDLFALERGEIRRAIDREEIDVIHAHWTYEFAMAGLESGLPLVVTAHDWAPAILRQNRDAYRFLRLVMQCKVLRRSTYITAPSEYIQSRIRKYFRKECVMIPNGIPMQAYRTMQLNRPSRKGVRTVGMLNASADTRKNIANGLKAWQKVRHQWPEAQLVLAGPDFDLDGPAHKAYKKAGLANGVQFRGSIPSKDVPGWMASLDVFLHPSKEESFGIVLIEAMAAGAYVVAGINSGAVSEVVGEAGQLIDVTNVDAIAEALISALSRSDEISRVDAQAGFRQADKYDLELIAKGYLKHLRIAIQRERRSLGSNRTQTTVRWDC